jgi:hypothetical protein
MSPLRDMIFTWISYKLYFLNPICNQHALCINTSQGGRNGVLAFPQLNAVLFTLKAFHPMCVSRNRRGSLEIRSTERYVSFHRSAMQSGKGVVLFELWAATLVPVSKKTKMNVISPLLFDKWRRGNVLYTTVSWIQQHMCTAGDCRHVAVPRGCWLWRESWEWKSSLEISGKLPTKIYF